MKAQRTIVQFVHLDETGDSYYRMRWPAAQLATLEPSWRVINLNVLAKERFEYGEKADLLVVYQSADPQVCALIKRRRERGRKTLVEYNDNFYAPQAWSPVAAEWQSPLLWQKYEQLMTEADGVIVTGPGLAELFSSRVAREKIHIIENLFPHEPEPFARAFPSSTGEVTIGWGGSLGHMADFLSVAPILKEVLDEAPGTRLRIMGNRAIPELVAFPADRFEFVHWGSVQEYFQFWKPVHIGIAPLLDTEYNRCRSDIKAVEMSACGVLPLLPDALPYRDFLQKTGLQPFRNFHDLKERLGQYVMRPERIREEAERCYNYVKNFRLGEHNRARLQLYSQHLSGRSDTFEWPVGAGYHELTGTAQDKTAVQEALAVADSFMKLRQPGDALRTLERLIDSNPDIPELILARLKILKNTADGALMAQLERAEAAFPGDLRFTLLHAQWADDIIGVVDGNMKYIYRVDDGAEELFNLAHDPQEKLNTAKANPAIAEKYRKIVLEGRQHARSFYSAVNKLKQ
ncbi:MAG: hypothetical protein J0M12_12640 [Deltaproteobacteria bacterium]|nr:hypothetical protein [Deltaproteobacteria bacterium]